LLRYEKLLYFFSWNPQYIKESLHFSIPLIPHVAGVFFISMADRFFIAGELGVAQAGIYMLAAQLATVVSLVHESINRAFLPWLFEKLTLNKSEDKRMIVKFTYLWFATILASTPLLFFIGPNIVIVIAGPEYSEAGNVFGWLALGHSFGGMYAMLNCYIYFSKKTYSLSIVTLFSGILNIILLVFFLKIYGLVGAGIAFSISMLVRFFLTWFLAHYVHPMPWFSIRKQVTSVN
jgi:O-antigen/teichoic acid export membrane protein